MTNKLLQMLLGICFSSLAYGQQGLIGEYYDGDRFDKKIFTRTDPQINFVWDNVAPAAGMRPDKFSVRWTGRLKAPKTGEYLFRAKVDDGIRVRIGNRLVIDAWYLNDSKPFSGKIWLEAGQLYDLQVEYYNGMFEGEIQLFWQLPGDEPVFGGTFGYNDHLIEGRYYFQPERPAAQAPVQAPTPAPVATKPATRPATRPAAQQTAKPQPQPRPAAGAPASTTRPAPVSADTLEKYLPKNIHFVKSKAEMLPESTLELDRLAGFLLRHPQLRLSIAGHTDKVGDSAKNQELSELRARAVASYLVKKGVAAERIDAVGYGDSRPLVKDGNDVRNRRVEFVIH